MAEKNIGGQAVLEGVMLRDGSNGKVAVANRLESGKIYITQKDSVPLTKKNKFLSLPIVRGVAAFIDSLITGTKTLMDSAEIVGGDAAEEYEPSRFEKFLAEKLKVKLEDVVIFISVLLGLGLAILLFTVVPTVVTGLFKGFIKSGILLSLCEGIIKLIMFIAYILLVSRQRDIKRVFQYHGSEHKTINCYEADMEVTVENVRKCSRIHPRCGTSFMFFVMAVSILLFSLIPWGKVYARVLLKLLLLPVVSGISYEIIRFSGKSKSKVVKALVSPGLLLQRITTAEPDDSQIEIGIASLIALIRPELIPEITGENNEAQAEEAITEDCATEADEPEAVADAAEENDECKTSDQE